MTKTKTIKAIIAAALVVALVAVGGGAHRPTHRAGRREVEIGIAR